MRNHDEESRVTPGSNLNGICSMNHKRRDRKMHKEKEIQELVRNLKQSLLMQNVLSGVLNTIDCLADLIKEAHLDENSILF